MIINKIEQKIKLKKKINLNDNKIKNCANTERREIKLNNPIGIHSLSSICFGKTSK